jgi:hypothetical protein
MPTMATNDAPDLEDPQTGKMVSYRTQESDEQCLRWRFFLKLIVGKIDDPI